MDASMDFAIDPNSSQIARLSICEMKFMINMAIPMRVLSCPIWASKWRVLQPSLCSNSANFPIRNASKSSRKPQKKKKNSAIAGMSEEHQLLLKTFPNPKGILNNVILSNAKCSSIQDVVTYKTEDIPAEKKGAQVLKKSILTLNWPEVMAVEGSGRKKRGAELVAAALACARLKELGLMDDNNNPLLPDVVYKTEDRRIFLRKQNQPDIIEADEQVSKELSSFLKKLKNQESKNSEDNDQTHKDLSFYSMMMSEEETAERVTDIFSDKPYKHLSESKRDIRNGILLQRLINQRSNPDIAEIMKKVQTLPILDKREEILSIINANQVVVLCGETGCGKTTQMPQFLLDDWIRQDMGSQCNIVITQPRRISTISTAERIALERGEKVGKTVGYQIRLHRRMPESHGCMLVCTTGILLKKLQQNPDLTGISHVIVDEVHERDVNTDFLLVLLKNALERNTKVKLILMSASINPGLFSKYFDDCPMINVPGFMYPVKEYFLPETLADLDINPNKHKSPLFEQENKTKAKDQSKKSRKNQRAPPTNVDLVVEVIKAIDEKKPAGAILCFLPGWQDIKSVYDKLLRAWDQSRDEHEVYPVHSHITVDNQQAMFDIPPVGVRKVVLATNVAETSITIGDVVYVVNTGNHKEERFDSDLGVSCLDLHWASKANITQRKGRAGRRQPGECFHLFDEDVYKQMSKFQTAEILRIPLEQIVVQAKVHNEAVSAEMFLAQALEPPPSQAVSGAIDLLQDLDILNEKEELTSLGKKISCFGSDPRIAKAIIFSTIFRCVDPILTIAASLCNRDIFRENLDNRKLIMKKMKEYSGDGESDHLMRVALYQGWEEQQKAGRQSAFSYVQSHHLSLLTLQFIRGLRRQFASNLEDSGMVMMSSECFDPSARCNENSGDPELIKAVICSAFYPNLLKARFGKHEKGKLRTNKLIFKDLDSNNILLHRRSVNCGKKDFRSKWLTYFSKIRSDVTFVRDCSVIHPMAVVAFAGNTLYIDKLSQRERKEVLAEHAGISPAHLVKLVIDDEQIPHESGEDGSEFSPWEGLPITFYMTKDTALYTMAFIKAMKHMTEECLTNEAAFLSGSALERHSALLSLFSKLLGTQVLHSQQGQPAEQVEQKQLTSGS
ncbi:ATP-dependent RNA helicase DHX30 [Strongylocentrotus purpuratus]|uniref:ATP-dependent RNA helicase DHX30 n=1 Tax=Strongylocentrotus purpuratus TaxID=7668 RepID=A0A7M7PVN8_STRPU|nr:ATP-dependent RNA helicase DHX30 [Strongylocentrotus purpuratus]